MAVLRFKFSKTDKEWEMFEKTISEQSNAKTSVKGSGMNRFICLEVNRMFKGKNKDKKCPKSKFIRKPKGFEITVDDEIAESVTCEANELGISIGELISRKIFDRYIDAKPTTGA